MIIQLRKQNESSYTSHIKIHQAVLAVERVKEMDVHTFEKHYPLLLRAVGYVTVIHFQKLKSGWNSKCFATWTFHFWWEILYSIYIQKQEFSSKTQPVYFYFDLKKLFPANRYFFNHRNCFDPRPFSSIPLILWKLYRKVSELPQKLKYEESFDCCFQAEIRTIVLT